MTRRGAGPESSSRISSPCRRVPVFSSTRLSWERPVLMLTPACAQISSRLKFYVGANATTVQIDKVTITE